MELGELELAVLRAVRALGEASPGEIYREVRRARSIAYTSVTTTLYRLVDKDLIAVRRETEKRAFYRIKDGRAYRKALATMMDRLMGTFGDAAVSYILARREELSDAERDALRAQVAKRRKEEEHG